MARRRPLKSLARGLGARRNVEECVSIIVSARGEGRGWRGEGKGEAALLLHHRSTGPALRATDQSDHIHTPSCATPS